ncbi:DUF6301 family protein [Nocardia sp. KC 131]|uniref:DUF6301 family protein n=1 Tax=Nocardia arseniciresistens TaxID=3392119 RepID=UPI00398E8D7B
MKASSGGFELKLIRRFRLVVSGRLDQAQLEELRAVIGLTPSGTADDPVGSELGCRTRNHPRYTLIHASTITLLRTGADEWSITIDAIPYFDIATLIGLVEVGCRAAGLTVIGRHLTAGEAPIDTTPSAASLERARKKLEETGMRLWDTTLTFATTPSVEAPQARITSEDDVTFDYAAATESMLTRDVARPAPKPLFVADDIPVAQPTPRPIGWQGLSDNEIADLAEKLRTLVWSWRMDDLLRLTIVFGWREVEIHSADWVQYDTGPGSDTVDIIGLDGDALRVEVTVSAEAADTPEGRSNTLATYARMAEVLTGSIGEPTGRFDDRVSEFRWAGPRTTLRLIDFYDTVRLQVVTNDWLSALDQGD